MLNTLSNSAAEAIGLPPASEPQAASLVPARWQPFPKQHWRDAVAAHTRIPLINLAIVPVMQRDEDWAIRIGTAALAKLKADSEPAVAAHPATAKLLGIRRQVADAGERETRARARIAELDRQRTELISRPGEPDQAAVQQLGTIDFGKLQAERELRTAERDRLAAEKLIPEAYDIAEHGIALFIARSAHSERCRELIEQLERKRSEVVAAVPAVLLDDLVRLHVETLRMLAYTDTSLSQALCESLGPVPSTFEPATGVRADAEANFRAPGDYDATPEVLQRETQTHAPFLEAPKEPRLVLVEDTYLDQYGNEHTRTRHMPVVEPADSLFGDPFAASRVRLPASEVAIRETFAEAVAGG